jgi:hypothetical protein
MISVYNQNFQRDQVSGFYKKTNGILDVEQAGQSLAC